MATKKLNILVIASEVAPFAKVGGLADVAGSLPKALKALGHDVRVVMPSYKMIETNPAYAVEEVFSCFPVHVRPGMTEEAYLKRTRIPGGEQGDIPVYLIGNHGSKPGKGYFQQATESKKVYALEPEPYAYFCRAVLEMLTHLQPDWKPDVLHCNDWQTGLIPVYAQQFYSHVPAIAKAATVFTIHNLSYQGNFDAWQWPAAGLESDLFNIDGLEFYGQWAFMKGGLRFADQINTVSPNYAREIQTPEYGCGLEGLMQTLAQEGRLTGILNGIDYDVFNPTADPCIKAKYSEEKPQGKAKCKAALQEELGLAKAPKAAVIGLVSRLADQKGLDLIHAIMEPMLKLDVQFVLLGTGDKTYEKYFTKMQAKHPNQVHARIAFDVELAQRIYAGSDLFLMPSRFEPCGLGQMIALRYGTLPIVRATGGLADTVHDFDPVASPKGNGFVFTEYRADALLDAIQRAVNAFQEKPAWAALVERALASDFSWQRSARSYITLFEAARKAHRQRTA